VYAAPNNALGAEIAQTLGITITREASAIELLRRPELDYARLMQVASLGPGVDDAAVAEQVEVGIKYAGYLDRQRDEIERQRRHESLPIPLGFAYADVRGLSAEVGQKLARVQPATVGQAARISGVTPAAISLLLVHLRRGQPDDIARSA
jgi:tRNA uridine 5-carboxymethylaminomethyl modification enzyme